MRSWFTRLTIVLMAMVLGLFLVVGQAWAEDGGGTAESSGGGNMFKNFFVCPDPTGTVMIWILILGSVVTIALIIQHTLLTRRTVLLPDESVQTIEALLNERKYREAIELTGQDQSLFGQVLNAALSQAAHGYGSMQDAIDDSTFVLSARIIRKMEALNVLGAVGPMGGLFGTVYGMILTFFKMADAGGQPKPADLAGGISASLVTTFWGLVIAIPAVIMYGMLRAKVEGLTEEIATKSVDLIKPFRPAPKR